jgi:hypothetical protein
MIREELMKHLILVSALLALAPFAVAQQLYKYVDKDGKTIYSDTPPANVDSKQLKIQPGPPAAAPAPAKTALEKDKELDKGRKEGMDKAKKGEQEAKRVQENEERCANARNNLKVAENARRPTRLNEQGETVYLDEKEIEATKEQRRADVEKACKTS